LYKNNIHWPYYLSIESDVDKLSRYIEFTEDNYSTYSVELVRIFLSICSEVDVVMKEICAVISPTSTPSSINQYKDIIKTELPGLITESAISSKFGLCFQPWIKWESGKISPDWWVQHNNVKHQRNNYYYQANLRNVLEALAALYIANIYLHFVACKENSEFIFSVSDTVTQLTTQLDFYRIDNLFAYIRE
jgi:hypothetical protein